MNIHEVAKETGLKERTIHDYIRRGLIDSPGMGRGAEYDRNRVETLKLIKKLREDGTPIAAIFRSLNARRGRTEAYASERRDEWVRYTLTSGIELHVRKDVEKEDHIVILQILSFIRARNETEDERKKAALNRDA